MVRSPDQVRERDWLEVGGFVRGEASLGWLGVAGRAEKKSRKREESERKYFSVNRFPNFSEEFSDQLTNDFR